MSRILIQFYRIGLIVSIMSTVLRIIEKKIRAKKTFKGIAIIWVSLIFWFFGFVMAMITVFFRLSDLTLYVMPGLATSLISLGAGLIISLVGIYVMKS